MNCQLSDTAVSNLRQIRDLGRNEVWAGAQTKSAPIVFVTVALQNSTQDLHDVVTNPAPLCLGRPADVEAYAQLRTSRR